MKSVIYFKSVMMMVVMTVFATSMVSCGGDDDDDVPGGNAMVGVHRIDIQFSENTLDWNRQCAFHGFNPDGSYSTLYEDGTVLSPKTGRVAWTTEDRRDVSVYSDNNTIAMLASVVLIAPNEGSSADATVTLVGYVNNKRIYTKVYTLPAGKRALSVSLTTENGGSSAASIDGEKPFE